MRDLARGLSEKRGNSRIKNILRFLIILVLIGFFGFFVKNQFGGISSGGSSIALTEAPRGLKPVRVDNTRITGEGINLTNQQARFRDVKYDGEGEATATRSFGGGVYILSVKATLPDPKNTYYQVWLANGDNIVPVDYMRGSKNTWSLTLRDKDKYSSYGGIWITLERTKDEIPEEHVLEGSF
ncbi:hypothetical protein A2697_00235 [Candidatus Curtissbacteria bacterium RIFCSPHIGHO2_01_FULL_41_44]|uniref:Anti-sigma factor n=1 Tax=Candidatus Curtissbacteria bacterium RIFCSPLOWO2_01_FULL_42_50 TaxID=1797730 RepID=A0A1F5H2C8_9BACT|nr:MAG: hypothetical protein A2697_00235 [Candidatus Curtissbacteria bacterium RIFCSPHIGHO2_01_FULL_41_44]OGD92642.1 MAG: hypothetical protein A3C33_03465 [Candidatus Curtissbacteria bacterium RIFCSPHIGHO2_02_FULL_42_58]OGD96386.1 MAG: hypothetical protein A3E71_05050 [Candidatus Curtissbacteria bacterium RIFCSPHIGHO2_12_FULL_42_33]OGD98197.1 MAG: hypothetical protein A3B54_02270 [Candidatus Curtissbacteria bacterium RIFCSPLOWO2_01_FULL_42_50]OGE02794.1 MAG: hypothetical protein A3G16_03225 [Ca